MGCRVPPLNSCCSVCGEKCQVHIILGQLVTVLCSARRLLFPSLQLPRRLRFPPYKGCIELDDLNENVLSLYNFRETFNLNTTEVEPCRR